MFWSTVTCFRHSGRTYGPSLLDYNALFYIHVCTTGTRLPTVQTLFSRS